MTRDLLMEFNVDKTNKKIFVTREFDAPLNNVWAAWTQSELLDQWWAPRPFKTITKTMDFSEGGFWLYVMKGPKGESHWCRADYKKISPVKGFSYRDSFCDESGVVKKEFPGANWDIKFEEAGEMTLTHIELTYKSIEDLEKIIEMGFKEGFTMAMGNLDKIFANSK